MLGVLSSDATLHRVILRSAADDALLARQRLDRALSTVEWKPAGLPEQSVLIVRRLAPVPRTDAGDASFPQRVSLALQARLGRARRPWVHDDAFDADAVVFVDEAELIACLARDWLHGAVSSRWWWRSVLADAGAQTWLRRLAATHPQLWIPAVSLLEGRNEAAAFIERMEVIDCADVAAAIARSHAIVLDAAATQRSRAPDRPEAISEVSGTPVDAPEAATRGVALERLLAVVPELVRTSNAPSQRRLLALVLALIRAPTWARTPALPIALDFLDETSVEALTNVIRGPALQPARQLPASESFQASAKPREHAEPAREAASETPTSPQAAPARRKLHVVAAIEQAAELPIHSPHRDRAAPSHEAISETPWEALQSASRSEFRPLALPAERDNEGEPRTPQAARSPPLQATAPLLDALPRTKTQFGGLFYLLNAALAMGIYSDFTAPRGKNLELSPWDWLALVGDAWLGDEFREDAVWNILADLAGRRPEEAPDREFRLPHEGWKEEHLAMLRARLTAAIGTDDDENVPSFVCRHPGSIEVTPTTVHVHLLLARIDMSIRVAGLDRDPGWIPAAGRNVRFHFD